MTSQIEINSFITTNGVPTVSLPEGYPKIRIWAVQDSTYTLIVGDPSGEGQNTDGVMRLVSIDGFWAFTFTDTIGYDTTEKYLIRIDNGPDQPSSERYKSSEINPLPFAQISSDDILNIASATATQTWEESQSSHNNIGSMGFAINQTRSDVASMFVNIQDVQQIVNLIIKYDTNRTKIDIENKQLIIYDNDCVTVLRIFQLLDASGTPSTDSVCERVPIAQTDGLPTC